MLSANVQGLRDPKKRYDVIDYFIKMKPDILCLEDTHLLESDESDICNQWPGEIIINGIKTNSRGVAVLFNNSFEYKILNIKKDQNGNLIEIDINTHNINFKIIVIYAPNTDDPLFFEQINDSITNSSYDYFLICGDFNLVLDPTLDSNNYKNINNPKARQKILDIISEHDLVDLYRHNNPTTKRYTWRRKNPIKQARLDYFIASSPLTDITETCQIKSSYRSDRKPLPARRSVSPTWFTVTRWVIRSG